MCELAEHVLITQESVIGFDLRTEDALAPSRDIVNRLNEVPELGRIAILPGLAIMTTGLGFNFLGDWLRDFLDPPADV